MFPSVHIISKKITKAALLLLTMFFAMPQVWAAGPPRPSIMNNPVVLTLVIVMFILLLVIGILSNVVLGAAGFLRTKEKEAEAKKEPSSATTVIATLAGLLLFSMPVLAQDATATEATQQVTTHIGGVPKNIFYLIMAVIGVEVLVIFSMLFYLRTLLVRQKKAAIAAVAVVKPVKEKKKFSNWWAKVNRFKPIEQEADLELDHNYDGIRELDNRLPPWWLYGFYVSIIFAVVYLWRFHVSETAPLAEEELKIAMQEAEIQKANYLKNSANNIDENTVKYLTEATDLESGKKIYEMNCTPCHGKSGEGVVGPNLTDEYWLHGGSVSDVFKSLKYGWPDKGMRAWKDDFSPKQLAQLTSYIKSIGGTKPANAKAAEGEIYTESASADSTKAVAVK